MGLICHLGGPVLTPRKFQKSASGIFLGQKNSRSLFVGHLVEFVGLILVAVFIMFGDSGANLDTWGTNLARSEPGTVQPPASQPKMESITAK